MVIRTMQVDEVQLNIMPINLLDVSRPQNLGFQTYLEGVEFEGFLEQPYIQRSLLFYKVQSLLLGSNTQQYIKFGNVYNLTRGIYTLSFVLNQKSNFYLDFEIQVEINSNLVQTKTITQNEVYKQYNISFKVENDLSEQNIKLIIKHQEPSPVQIEFAKPQLYKSVHTFVTTLDINNMLDNIQNGVFQSLNWTIWDIDQYQYLYSQVEINSEVLTLKQKWVINYQKLSLRFIQLISFNEYQFSIEIQTADQSEYDVEITWYIKEKTSNVVYESDPIIVHLTPDFKRVLLPIIKYNGMVSNNSEIGFTIKPIGNNLLYIKLKRPFLQKSLRFNYQGILTYDNVKNELDVKKTLYTPQTNYSRELYKWKVYNQLIKISNQHYNLIRHPVYKVQKISNDDPIQIELDNLNFSNEQTYVFRISIQRDQSQEDVYDKFNIIDVPPLLENVKMVAKIIQNNNVIQEDSQKLHIQNQFKNVTFKFNINANSIQSNQNQTLRLEIYNVQNGSQFYIKTPLLFKNNNIYTNKIQQLTNLQEQDQQPLYFDVRSLPNDLYVGTVQFMFYYDDIFYKNKIIYIQRNLKLRIYKRKLYIIINNQEYETNYEFYESNVYFVLLQWKNDSIKFFVNGLNVGTYYFTQQDFSTKMILLTGEDDQVTHFMKDGLNQPIIMQQISDTTIQDPTQQYYEQVFYGYTSLGNVQRTLLMIEKIDDFQNES